MIRERGLCLCVRATMQIANKINVYLLLSGDWFYCMKAHCHNTGLHNDMHS